MTEESLRQGIRTKPSTNRRSAKRTLFFCPCLVCFVVLIPTVRHLVCDQAQHNLCISMHVYMNQNINENRLKNMN